MSILWDNWCVLPTPVGEFRMYDTGNEHVRVICLGDVTMQGVQPLLRVHSSCLASEVFGAVDCDCADQLRETMKRMVLEGRGLIIHLHQEGRGHGLAHKIKAVGKMQQEGLDTAEAFVALGLDQDIRDYGAAVNVLQQLGLTSVRLISNNPRKVNYLQQYGIAVVMVNTHPVIRPENSVYLTTKQQKLGHQLRLDADDQQSGEIRFYHSDQPWGEFSNFSQHAIYVHGRVWPTVEHYYQAQKFADTLYAEKIRCCATPMLAKQRATALTGKYCREDWATMKDAVMLTGLRAKFSQHPDLQERLRQSGSRHLVEYTAHDSYWGDAGDGTGENRLGQLLMQVRVELAADSGPAVITQRL